MAAAGGRWFDPWCTLERASGGGLVQSAVPKQESVAVGERSGAARCGPGTRGRGSA